MIDMYSALPLLLRAAAGQAATPYKTIFLYIASEYVFIGNLF